jgi:hypothetical protein
MNSADGLAFIGRNPGDPNILIVTGDSGVGLTHGTIAGILIIDLIQGRGNPWETLYDPSRKMVRAAAEFTRENLNTAGFRRGFKGGILRKLRPTETIQAPCIAALPSARILGVLSLGIASNPVGMVLAMARDSIPTTRYSTDPPPLRSKLLLRGKRNHA